MNSRIESELALLRQHYDKVDYQHVNAMHWFRVQMLKTPDNHNWSLSEIAVVFAVTEGYPGAEPYGFFVPEELNLDGKPPSDNQTQHQPPFEGKWRFLSWCPQNGWQATADVRSGPNLWAWVRSFRQRLQEGV